MTNQHPSQDDGCDCEENRRPLGFAGQAEAIFEKGLKLMVSLDAIAKRIDEVTQAVGRGATQATGRAARLMGDLQKTKLSRRP